MSKCPSCGNDIPLNKAFCSKECKEIYFKKISIQIPKPLIEMVYLKLEDEESRTQALKDFANRHGFEFELLKEKADKLGEEIIAMQYEKLKIQE